MTDKQMRAGQGSREIIFSAGLLLIFSLLTVGFLNFYIFTRAPGPDPDTSVKRILVEPGMTFNQVAKLLNSEGIIGDVDMFSILAIEMNAQTRIQAGEFELSSSMTPVEVLDRLKNGRVMEYRFTVPEGYNIAQMADVLDSQGMWSGEKFKELALSKEFTKGLGIDADTLEGYLFPETYQFPKGATEGDILKAMVKRLNQVFTDEWLERAEEIKMTRHEVLTLASLIEKETSAEEERPLISSVFHRRLKIGMKLDCDPTVIYGIPNFNGNLRRKDLEKWTPYNTYMNPGLPPGPIASPGAESIRAALYPADAKYLFFVSKGDGTHYFSESFSEHERAVREYQLRRGR